MTDKRKKRDIHKEIMISFFVDCIVLVLVSTAITILTPTIGSVGSRNMVALGIMYAAAMEVLMIFFEKYEPGISGIWEKCVIAVLSALISWVAFAFLNLVFFTSLRLLVLHTCIVLITGAVLIVENIVLSKYYENSKRFRKARLLIIDSDGKNINRMKRIKYGVTKNYDSWYEKIENKGENYMEKFADENFPKFDSICILDGLTDAEYNVAVKKAMGMNKELFLVPKIVDIGKCRAQLVRFDDILTLYMPEHSLNLVEATLKRCLDILFSGLGLIVAAIPMGLIALAIKLTSPGPVFYKQLRLTKDKREFYIYKFRTMIPDAEKLTGPMFAQKDDPRITKIGKILRACRLDELPQLINIFNGDMSIVGPRPERPVFVEQFEKEVENYDYRFRVKAGLTALSHVYGRYSTYIHDRTCYDLYYIANYSILLDLKIILLTAKTMFLKNAAEGEDEFKAKTASSDEKEVELK